MSEDPEAAQARVFLEELDVHARRLARRRATAGPGLHQSITAELAYIQQQIDNILRRFPQLRLDAPE